MRICNRILVCALGLWMAGCQTAPKVSPETSTLTFNSAPYTKETDEALKAIATSLRVLAETGSEANRQRLTTSQRMAQYNEARAMPYGFDVLMNEDGWEGPIESVLQVISAKTGYRFISPIGRKPKDGLIVRYSAHNRTAYDVIRDVSSQVKSKAKVQLIVNRNPGMVGEITLQYK